MDRIIETEQGYDCVVEDRRFGTWATRAAAVAGMAVEQDRASRRRVLTPETWNELLRPLTP